MFAIFSVGLDKGKALFYFRIQMKTISEEPHIDQIIQGTHVIVLGTAHISQKSTDEVQRLIKDWKPDVVGVELCETRKKNIMGDDHWKKLDLFQVIKNKKGYLLLSSLILSSFQKRIGGTKPGEEFRMAISTSESQGIPVHPIDRDVQTTLKRAWNKLGFFQKSLLFSQLIGSLFVKEKISEETIESMKKEDVLKGLFDELPGNYAPIIEVIIDERDQFMAQKIRESSKNTKKALHIVGAGHLKGIEKYLTEEREISTLETIPTVTIWSKMSSFVFPVIIISIFAFLFYKGGQETGIEFLYNWIIIKAFFGGLGALIAWAHPLGIIASAIVSPIGNFNPVLKPGWIAALIEAYFRKPLVEDFEKLAEDTNSMKGIWKNRVTRVFLVLMLPQIGSSIGTFVATYIGMKNIF